MLIESTVQKLFLFFFWICERQVKGQAVMLFFFFKKKRLKEWQV
jgi:hypothetical protein